MLKNFQMNHKKVYWKFKGLDLDTLISECNIKLIRTVILFKQRSAKDIMTEINKIFKHLTDLNLNYFCFAELMKTFNM